MALTIPAELAANCRNAPERASWLNRLEDTLASLEQKWSITLGPPFKSEAAWVAPVTLADGKPAVLKLGMPHMEGAHELQGMLFWNGDPTLQVLNHHSEVNALLLERCSPGTTLRELPEAEQDIMLAGLLRRMWRLASATHTFRPLSAMTQFWSDETLADIEFWPDSGLVREGLRLFHELPRSASVEVLLATDMHAGNVLRAKREPWLVIDPKPFVGDPAYDATQHLFNCAARMRSAPHETIRRFADLLGIDNDRVRLWMFARAAAEPRTRWENDESISLARAIA